ncbi:MAG: hypothetical protein LBQ44_04670 [Treponema sp.]|jgi:hypothetical protein|nr:hypothetical protein [Treponema sp.]
MKKIVLLSLLLTAFMGLAAAQEVGVFSLGLGVEGCMNTRYGVALEENLSFDYGIVKTVTAGIKFGFSQDFTGITVLAPEAFARWYFTEIDGNPLFVQVDLGASLIMEDSRIHPVFLGGLMAGIRFPLNAWYVEPSVRIGYPFIWGAGAAAGYRF